MCSGILTLNGPGVSDVLHDHAALAVWEQLRIARRALDLRAVSARCALEHVDALRALDLLSAAGLVERVTAAHRRGIRWRVTCDRIVIAFEPHEHAVAAELSERVYGSHSERVADTIARFGVRRSVAGLRGNPVIGACGTRTRGWASSPSACRRSKR